MANSEGFIEYILDQLSEWHGVYTKRMFGGIGLYQEALMFGMIDNDVVYLKVDDSNRKDYVALGSSQFKPFKEKPGIPSFYDAPLEVIDDYEEFIKWAKRSYAIQVKRNKIT